MEDAEIIKALKTCASRVAVCEDCPYLGQDECMRKSTLDALDLIKRQQEMIEALIAGQETLQKHFADKMDKIVEQLKELADESIYGECDSVPVCENYCTKCYLDRAIAIVKGVQNE